MKAFESAARTRRFGGDPETVYSVTSVTTKSTREFDVAGDQLQLKGPEAELAFKGDVLL